MNIKNLKVIGCGEQGTVYDLNDRKVIKIFKKRKKSESDKIEIEVAKKMSKLKLNRFVRPFNIKVKNKMLISYEMLKINFDKIPLEKIKMKNYIKSLRLIRKDSKMLSKVGIKINDLQEHNIGVEDGLITIFDSSDYTIYSDVNVERMNDEAINECFGSFCLNSCSDENEIEVYDKFYKPFILSGKEYVEDFFEEQIFDDEESLSDFVKKIVR